MKWSFCSIFTALALVRKGLGQSPADDDVKTVPLRTHSLLQPYLDSELQSRWFDWGGDTIVRADQYVRLTSDRQQQSGWLWSRLPLTATNWEVEVEFKIHGQGNLYGDGMAMWITKERAMQGPVFGAADKFEGLGVFFDTYKNNRPGVVFPYVMAMLGDGQTVYQHGNDGKENELAGCSARGIRGAPVATKARLTYFQENYLQLELQYKSEDQWILCFNVPNVTLPQITYLGFTAETGELSDNHDIITVSSKNLYQINVGSGSSGGKRPGKADTAEKASMWKPSNEGGSKSESSGGWGWFFLKMIIFIVVIVGGYVGYTVYRAQNRSSRF
ncbi:legume-like lectin family-domain-containing protein [Tuber borchii]|uniref:Legume-like lectin family-domain-containing protein n=1 Tax=Tuber borchii TaxID=42251 RepID=A0A2T6Z9V3_TUBBO|nr:legume-like lectin family-domain-containing protein [Tuber borchii]